MLELKDGATCKSVQELLLQLCNSFNKDKNNYNPRQTRSKLFEILLRFTSPKNTRDEFDTKPNLNDLDMFFTELYLMQSSREFDRANQLHGLLFKLKDQTGAISVEAQSILKFLLCLSSWPNRPPDSLGASWKIPDINGNADLCDISQYPSIYGDTRMYKPSFYYMQYPSEIFESVAQLPAVASDIKSQIFEATPGFDECGNPLFGYNCSNPLIFSSNLSSSHLFGACHEVQGARPDALLLPVLTCHSSKRPMSFTLSRAQSFSSVEESDTSVDEGFIEPDCEDTSKDPDPSEIWEIVSKLPHKIRRSWDHKHRLTDKKDPLYLCQSGHLGGQMLHLGRLYYLQLLDPQIGQNIDWLTTFPKPTFDKLIKDIINLLLGIPSSTFMYDKQSHLFRVRQNINLPGLTSEPLSQVLKDFLDCGSLYLKLEAFALPEMLGSYLNNGLVMERLREGVSQYLQHYRGCILYAKETQSSTLLTLHHCVLKAYRQLRYLTDLCLGERQLLSRFGQQSTLPKGLKLLTWLFQHAVQEWGGENDLLLMFLLKTACAPYLKFLHDWVFEGTLNDPYSEFNIQISEYCLTNQNDKSLFWSHGYILKEKMRSVPFLGDIVTQSVLLCGKSLNLLKICDPKHSLLDSRHPRPDICISLTNADLLKSAEISQKYYDSLNSLLFTTKPDDHMTTLSSTPLPNLKISNITPDLKTEEPVNVKNDKTVQKINVYSAATPLDTNDEEILPEKTDFFHDITNQVKVELTEHYTHLIKEAELQEQKLLWQAERFELQDKRSDLFRTELTLQSVTEETHDAEQSELDNEKCSENLTPEIEVVQEETIEKAVPENISAHQKHECRTSVESKYSEGIFKEANENELPADILLKSESSKLQGNSDKAPNKFTEPTNDEETESAIVFSNDDVNNKNVQIIPELEENNNNQTVPVLEQLDSPSLEEEEALTPPRVQPYQTEYLNLGALPHGDLLLSLDMFGPAQDWEKDQEVDCLSVPLLVLFQRSLDPPLQAQARLVNQAVLRHFKENLQLHEHFVSLRNFFFFNDGEFGRMLSHLIFKKASTVKHYRDLLNPFYLRSILNAALNSCYSGDCPQSENLSLGLKIGCNTLPSPGFPILMNLELNYKVDWPLNIVVSEDSEVLYNRIFGFLLQVKHVIWTLTNTWYHLKQSDQLYHLSNHWQFRQIQIFRHEMLHFVQTVHEYVSSQILQVVWQEFLIELNEKVNDLEQLRIAHMSYLQKACTRCMLGGGTDISLQRSMDMAFQLSLHFHTQLLSLPWHQGIPLAEDTFSRLVNTHQHFKHQTEMLYKALKNQFAKTRKRHYNNFLNLLHFDDYYTFRNT